MKVKEIFKLPLFSDKVAAGFPTPAEDLVERNLDLNELMIQHPASTFFVRVAGESMINANIQSGDILVVDRSLEAKNNSIVIAMLNGEFTVKRIKKNRSKIVLAAENSKYKEIEITENMNFEIWGIVTFIIHEAR